MTNSTIEIEIAEILKEIQADQKTMLKEIPSDRKTILDEISNLKLGQFLLVNCYSNHMGLMKRDRHLPPLEKIT